MGHMRNGDIWDRGIWEQGHRDILEMRTYGTYWTWGHKYRDMETGTWRHGDIETWYIGTLGQRYGDFIFLHF